MRAYKHEEAAKRHHIAVYCECQSKSAIFYYSPTDDGEPDIPICLICGREGGWRPYAHYSTTALYCNCLDKGG